MGNSFKQIILVDENDQEVGVEEKQKAHEQALCHRAFSVFIFKETADGLETLLQKRQVDKYHCGGLWTNACCSHPSPGEHTQVAAQRRLEEELGVKMNLHYVSSFHYIAVFENGLTENEVDHVFWVDDSGENYQLNPDEVSNIKWVNVDSLLKDLVKNNKDYTPWLKPALIIALTREKNVCEY